MNKYNVTITKIKTYTGGLTEVRKAIQEYKISKEDIELLS